MRVYVSKKYRLDKLLPLTHKEIIELSNKDKDVLKQCVGINNSTHKMFYNCLKLTEIPQLNISHVTDISYMFCRLGYNNPHSFYDKKINKYVTVSNKDLPQIDTSNVVDMSYMFSNCKHIIPSVLNTSNVENMSYTFCDCNIKELPQMNVREVTSMKGMFYGNCSTPTNNIELDCIKVQDMSYMFYNSLDFNKHIKLINTQNVTNMNYMFCNALVPSDLTNFINTSNVTTMISMFEITKNYHESIKCGFEGNKIIDFSNVNTYNVNYMSRMFYNSNAIEIKNLNMICCKNADRIFQGGINLKKVSLLNTSNLSSTIGFFSNCKELEQVNLFDTLNVKIMSEMFSGCKKLKTIPLYNIKKCIDMSNMFSYSGIQNIPLLDTSNVTNMSYMFMESAIETLPNLDTSNVTDMSYMFFGASNLTSLPLLNTSKVTTMKKMFAGTLKDYYYVIDPSSNKNLFEWLNRMKTYDFSNKLYTSIRANKIPNFDTGNVKDMSFMFENCFQKGWNEVLTANFNTENVVNMSYMFLFCLELKSIPVFDIRNVKHIKNMLFGTKVTEVTFKNKPADLQITSEILCGNPNQITTINFV